MRAAAGPRSARHFAGPCPARLAPCRPVIHRARSRRWLMTWNLVVPLLMVSLPGAPAGPLAHTFSIVARDAKTGELGVAVQSHYFSVGPIVPWVEAGVGA